MRGLWGAAKKAWPVTFTSNICRLRWDGSISGRGQVVPDSGIATKSQSYLIKVGKVDVGTCDVSKGEVGLLDPSRHPWSRRDQRQASDSPVRLTS